MNLAAAGRCHSLGAAGWDRSRIRRCPAAVRSSKGGPRRRTRQRIEASRGPTRR